ncbi:MAG TPA: pectin acetylesterase-family hydrolase [Polyangia bacterium]|nr:pectin acetylesterase-family hydrolase [Polyangia bacterium]
MLSGCGSGGSGTGGSGGAAGTGGAGGVGGAGGAGGAGGGGGGMIGPPPPGGWGMPITAPDMTWTWVDFPNSRCMNDTPTGIGVSLNSHSDQAMIWLEGGGACFNAATCNNVAHRNGFGAADLAAFASASATIGIFNRNDAQNPFKDWNQVFVPYCSGDVFGGNTRNGFGGRVQVGYQNMGEFLRRVVPTFASMRQVVLTGSSAGGFGAALNYDRAQTYFGTIPVHLLDDSGPPMEDMWLSPCLQQQFRTVWQLDGSLPADCTDCRQADGGGLYKLAIYIAQKYPNRRFGLISSLQDGTIRLFFGFGYPNCTTPQVPMPADAFQMGLEHLRDQVLAPYSNFRGYFPQSTQHVWLTDQLDGATVSGVKLTDWIGQLVSGAPGWNNVKP